MFNYGVLMTMLGELDIATAPTVQTGVLRRDWVVFVAYGVLTLLTFATLLFQGQRVISAPGTDVTLQFYAWREFGFHAIAHGDFPFWNPHLYGGEPYFGGMQSALLYPLNLIFLFLSTAVAINWSVALHVWLMGTFTYMWLRRGRGLGVVAAAFGGATAMFCAPFFLHIFAGHLPNISTMVWVPLVFLALERWFAGGSYRWLGFGAFAVAMQIFAGHPQYVYYTGLSAGLLTLLHIGLFAGKRRRKIGGFVVIYLLGAALGAVQLLPALESAGESVRASGVSYQFAADFSLPLANLATLFGPGIMGDMIHSPYRGQGLLWEMCLYFGVVALLLCVMAVVRLRDRNTLLNVLAVVILLILAVGAKTPLFYLLYHFLPGYDLFRGTTKFGFFAVLFAIALSARGAQWLLNNDKPLVTPALSVIGAALLVLLSISVFGNHGAGSNTVAVALFRAAMILVVAAVLIWLQGKNLRGAAPLLLALGVAVTMFNAWRFRPSFSVERLTSSPAIKFMAAHRDDGRILNLVYPNGAMLAGADEIWGYDPGVLRRWARFCTAIEGVSPALATQYLHIVRLTPGLALTDLRWVVEEKKGVGLQVLRVKNTLPPAFFARQVKLEKDGLRQLKLLSNEKKISPEQVLIEQMPPFGTKGSTGRVRMKWIDSDHIDLRTDSVGPGFVLLSVAYAEGWRATDADSGARYKVMPANYAFVGVSLPPGRHHVILSYRPTLFLPGLSVSILALAILLVGLGWQWRVRAFRLFQR